MGRQDNNAAPVADLAENRIPGRVLKREETLPPQFRGTFHDREVGETSRGDAPAAGCRCRAADAAAPAEA